MKKGKRKPVKTPVMVTPYTKAVQLGRRPE